MRGARYQPPLSKHSSFYQARGKLYGLPLTWASLILRWSLFILPPPRDGGHVRPPSPHAEAALENMCPTEGHRGKMLFYYFLGRANWQRSKQYH